MFRAAALRCCSRGLFPRQSSKSLLTQTSYKSFLSQSRSYAVASEQVNKGVDPNDSFLQGNTANYIDEMYLAWKKDPESVHISWQVYFKNVEHGDMPLSQAFQAPPTLVPSPEGTSSSVMPNVGSSQASDDVTKHLKVQLLVRAYQARGHLKSKIDPLPKRGAATIAARGIPKELELSYYGFTEQDMSTEFTLGPGILPRFITDRRTKMTLREIVDACETIYCQSIAVELAHISDREQADFLRERLEVPTPFKYSVDEKRRILDRLIWSDSLERFLGKMYPSDKRFGLQGLETLIPGMKALIDRSVDYGVKDIVIGMAHRGRINFLINTLRKSASSVFNEFSHFGEDNQDGSGDVKYHLGANFERPTPNGRKVHLSLVANPSHLESEDTVVLGRCRSIQHYNNDDTTHNTAMPVLMHGDAAFAGQGIVYETAGLAYLKNYGVGGLSEIPNNGIGFTTGPVDLFSGLYSSDIAKVTEAPVIHVCADDVESVVFVFQLASEWRAHFKRDIVIDLFGYRRLGHNESDLPDLTQPLEAQEIREKASQLELYEEKLLREQSFSKDDIEEHKAWVWQMLKDSYDNRESYVPDGREWLTSAWHGFKTPKELATEILPHLPTAVPAEQLKQITNAITKVPEGFNLHKTVARVFARRQKAVEEGTNIDWSTAEALAWGTLLSEGKHCRISGEDVQRGTFSQRHAVVHDQTTGKTWTPLQGLPTNKAAFTIANSSLSEYGVLGFEYGYSLTSPEAFCMWEAQFGDFANVAQPIIDQFIASGESKWSQRSSLVVSLPHGYDGQGPEHSSARIERFLQLCNDDPRVYPSEHALQRQHQDCNLQICMLTSPSNYFHILRRQMHRQFAKPLCVFFSKSLLRSPMATSDLSDFTGDSHFRWIIPDEEHAKQTIDEHDKIERIILCSGQVFQALHKHREKHNIRNTAIIRIEQIAPFPWAQLKEELDRYSQAKHIVHVQEESLNAGPASYIQPRVETLLNETEHHDRKHLLLVSRPPSSSPATGLQTIHRAEETELLEQAFSVKQEKYKGE